MQGEEVHGTPPLKGKVQGSNSSEICCHAAGHEMVMWPLCRDNEWEGSGGVRDEPRRGEKFFTLAREKGERAEKWNRTSSDAGRVVEMDM